MDANNNNNSNTTIGINNWVKIKKKILKNLVEKPSSLSDVTQRN